MNIAAATTLLQGAIREELRAEVREEVRAELMADLLSRQSLGKRLLDRDEVAKKLGISVRQLDRLRYEPDFPKPRRLSGNSREPKWTEEEIDSFIDRLRYI